MLSYIIIIYIPVILMLLFGNVLKKYDIILVINLILLTIISGLRYEVGLDYTSYYWIFNSFKFGRTNSYLENLEKGYTYLNKIIIFINGEFNLLLFIIATLGSYSLFRFLKYLKVEKKYYWIVFFGNLINYKIYFYQFSAIRQAIALYIFILSLKYIVERKIYKYLFFIFLSSLFHKSSIILIIPYILYSMNIRKFKKIVTVFLFFLIFFKFNGNLLIKILTNLFQALSFDKYIRYLEIKVISFGINYYLMFIFLIFALYLLKNKINSKEKLVLELIIIYYLVVISAGSGLEYIGRIRLYFNFFLIFYPIIIVKKIKSKNLVLLYLITFICYKNLIFLREFNQELIKFQNTPIYKYIYKYKSILTSEDKYKNRLFIETVDGKIIYIN